MPKREAENKKKGGIRKKTTIEGDEEKEKSW